MKTVCLCGSFKFYQEMNKVEEILVRKDIKCIKPVPFPHEDPRKSRAREEEEIGTKEHIENVKQADIIYVVDKDGYVGRSTSVEIGVAYGLGKKIYAMERIKDPAVDILVDEVLSPEELVSVHT
ncbi:MAG: nucleoside 2-deoxyribosyltransferase [Candidatus Bathyarchaeia archaeon]